MHLLRGEMILLLICGGILCLAATTRWHYYFYVLLRLLICSASVFLASRQAMRKSTLWAWTFGAVAVLFNPVFPVRMARQDWQVINLLTATAFGVLAIVVAVTARRERLRQRAGINDL